jgi:hypothetical protein
MPTCVAAPTEADQVRRAVARALTAVVNAALYGLRDAAAEGSPLDTEEQREREAPRAWLETSGDGAVSIRAEALGAARLISEVATRRLPGFVAGSYTVRIEITSIDAWLDGQPLDVRLRAKCGHGLIEEFAVEHAAEGYRLWIQLALLQALETALGLAKSFRRLAGDVVDAAQEAQDAEVLESVARDALERAADDERLEAMNRGDIPRCHVREREP